MLTDPQLRSKVESLWDKLWTGGLSNPLDAIEQLSYLLFLKQLDKREQDAERAGRMRGRKSEPLFPDPQLPLVLLEPASRRKGPQAGQRTGLPVPQGPGRQGRLVRPANDQRRVQDQQAQPVDLELGVGDLLAERAGLVAQVLEEREDLFFNLLEGLFRGSSACIRPTMGVGQSSSDFLHRIRPGHSASSRARRVA